MRQLARYTTGPTKRTPWVVLEPGYIYIFGRSIPENTGEFYRPVHEWISRYVPEAGGEIKIELGFEYINTSSTKWIYNIMKQFAQMERQAVSARFYWYYDRGDEDMCELGFILRSLVDSPFIVVELEKMNRKPGDPVLTENF